MIQLALYYNQREGKERIKKIKKILKNLLTNRNKKLIIRVKIRKGKVKKMMKMEQIIEKLETIKTDAYYYVDDEDNEIRLTIDDFEGFDEDWSEVERELENHKAVEEVLEWLEENADEVEGDYYEYYHFGEIAVCVGYASFDI